MPWTIPTSLVAGGFALLGLGIAATAQAEEQDRIHMELKDGTVVIKLRPDQPSAESAAGAGSGAWDMMAGGHREGKP